MKRKAFIIHNLTSSSLGFCDYLGGIVNPSLALISNEHPLDGFGGQDITLVMNKNTLEGKDYDAYEADSFSKRCPKIRWDLNHNHLSTIRDWVEETLKHYDISERQKKAFYFYKSNHDDNTMLEDGLFRKNPYLLSHPGLKLLYLKEKNIHLDMPLIENKMSLSYFKRETIKRFYDEGGFRDHDYESRKAFMQREDVQKDFKEWIMSLYNDEARESLTEEEIQSEMDYFMDSYQFDNGAISFSAFMQLEQDARDEAYSLDLNRVTDAMDEAITDIDEYERWIDEVLSDCFDKPYFFDSEGNKKVAKLDSLCREMRGKTQGSEEEIFTSPGNIRSALLKKFRNIDDLLLKSSDFISSEDFESLKDLSNKKMHDVVDNAMERNYKFDSNSMHYKSVGVNALHNYAKTGSLKELSLDFKIDEEMMSDIHRFFEELKGMPTEYCEIKLNEHLSISDFSVAIVRKNIPKESLEILRQAGLTIMTYSDIKEKRRLLLLSGEGVGDLGSFRDKAKDDPNLAIQK